MKGKRYWLRGGFLLLGIFIFVGIILSILHVTYFNLPVLVIFPLFTQILINPNSAAISLGQSQFPGFFEACFIDIFALFLVGATAGWIYGKIKNRNKVSQV